MCKEMKLFVVLEEGEEPPVMEDSSDDDDIPAEVLVEAAIGEDKSCHSLTNPTKAKAMRVQGYVNKTKVVVLLDSGATHKFMSLEAAQKLECPIEPQTPFPVMVGDGYKLSFKGQCKDLEIVMYKTPFKVNVFVLPIDRVDSFGHPMARHWGPKRAFSEETSDRRAVRGGRLESPRLTEIAILSFVSFSFSFD
ncbi:hypothetical protein EJ110_NYTH30513 [Nymphaea thermarum]|nr:hypothetical protein EJ110_NYTH30513 [Nymphaea thermarum]